MIKSFIGKFNDEKMIGIFFQKFQEKNVDQDYEKMKNKKTAAVLLSGLIGMLTVISYFTFNPFIIGIDIVVGFVAMKIFFFPQKR